MKRAFVVVLTAVVVAAVSGINDPSWALERQTNQSATDAQRERIRSRALTFPVGSPIEVEPTSGRKYKGVFEGVTTDAILIRVLAGNDVATRTVPLEDIKNLKRTRLGRSVARNIAIGAGVTAAVLVGACAIALANLDDVSPLAPSNPRGESNDATALP